MMTKTATLRFYDPSLSFLDTPSLQYGKHDSVVRGMLENGEILRIKQTQT
jgi:hypothetical protein